MKTNYDNLTPFESWVIVAAVIGLVLIGFEIYITLPSHQRTEVASAFTMFDMHQELTTIGNGIDFGYQVSENFYDQFYIAFTQVFSFPDQIGTPVLKFAQGLNEYSQSLSGAYKMNSYASQYEAGQVLGAILIKDTSTQAMPAKMHAPRTSGASTKIYKQYYYHAPAMVKKLINN